MGLFKSRKNNVAKQRIATGLEVPSISGPILPWFNFWRRTDYTLANSELIFSAVSRISNALSAMPIQLYKGSTPVRELAGNGFEKDMNELVSLHPSPGMTSSNFFKTMEACRLTSGDCYALKIYGVDSGRLERLDILDPSRVTPIKEQETGELWYKITPEFANEYYVHSFYVFHVPFMSTNGFSSVSPVRVLLNTLKYSDDIEEFNRAVLAKGINAAVVLEAPAQLGAEQRKNMIADFMDTYKKTAGNVLLLESGVQAKSLNMSPVDNKIFEVEKITRSKVAMVYNIPPHMMGDYSGTSYGSQEQEMLEFLQLTMLQTVSAYEQEANIKLLTRKARDQGYSWRFDINAMLRADANTMAEVNAKSIRNGWKTPDEVRKGEYLAPLPGGIGAHALISQDLATLDYTVNKKARILAAGKIDPDTGADITGRK